LKHFKGVAGAHVEISQTVVYNGGSNLGRRGFMIN
jgi:hypothetical protein